MTCTKRLVPLSTENRYAKKRCPQVLGLKRIYIQTRQEKRLSLTIGGRAYLLPKTSITVKCPARHFPKAQIRWEKNGSELKSSKRLSITKSGALRIYNLDPGDIGVYRCWAGQDSDAFILKLIGHNNRLLEHPEGLEKDGFHPFLNKEGYVGVKCHEQKGSAKKAFKSEPSWTQKNEFHRDDNGRPGETLARHSAAFVLEPAQFEELVRNITQLAESGDVTDEVASLLIGRIMEDLAIAEAGTAEPSTTEDNSLNKTPNSSKPLKKGSGAAIVRQKHHGSTMSFQRDLRIHVGGTAYLTNATHSLTLLCSAQGSPHPTLSWSKDGAPLQNSDR